MAAKSERGLVRPENQDSYLALPTHGFFCVADGMGGGMGGALASKWVCDGLAAAARLDASGNPRDRLNWIGEALDQANDRIRAYAREKNYRMMGSTVAIVAFDPAMTGKAKIIHAGDSRVYCLRKGDLRLLTSDHTVGNEMGNALSASSLSSKDLKSRRNPLTHVLTRAVGTEFKVRPESSTFATERGDRFLICSDGVHDMLDDESIKRLLSRGTPASFSTRAEEAIIDAGAADNFTFICFDVNG